MVKIKLSSIIDLVKHPVTTPKTLLLLENNQYTFLVDPKLKTVLTNNVSRCVNVLYHHDGIEAVCWKSAGGHGGSLVSTGGGTSGVGIRLHHNRAVMDRQVHRVPTVQRRHILFFPSSHAFCFCTCHVTHTGQAARTFDYTVVRIP